MEWLKTFAQPQKSKSNFPDRTDDLETNGGGNDENDSDHNSNFAENQDRDAWIFDVWYGQWTKELF